MKLLHTLVFGLYAFASMLCAGTAKAQAPGYPVKPIHIVTPYGPGGSADMIARLIADHLGKALGQPVVVENRPGASGTMGTALVAKAPPDGHTLLLAFMSEVAIAPHMIPKLPYDPLKDLAPVILAANYPMVLVVHPKLPAADVQELVALAKASPGKLAYATSGNGSPAHIAFELLKSRTGVDMIHVPYKGGGQALVDVVAGHTPMYFSGISPALPHVRSNQLRAIAVSSAKRSFAMPQVPSMTESGIRDFDITTWNGVFAPAGTPRSILDRLNNEMARILQMPDVAQRLAREGAAFSPNSPAEFADFVKNELGKYAQVIRHSNIKAE